MSTIAFKPPTKGVTVLSVPTEYPVAFMTHHPWPVGAGGDGKNVRGPEYFLGSMKPKS